MTTATKIADFAHRAFIVGLFGATVYIGVGTVQLVNARIEKNKIMRETWDAVRINSILYIVARIRSDTNQQRVVF
ncbi:hypothetical protein BGZ49_007546 [Haplosporangium sp. Z 27]|nr:hypothetical protein BGZ49_007546 [Haplosporangium sp. Z 27]